MTLAEHYNELAVRLRSKASNEESSMLKAEWEHLADCYARLAQQSQSFDSTENLALESIL